MTFTGITGQALLLFLKVNFHFLDWSLFLLLSSAKHGVQVFPLNCTAPELHVNKDQDWILTSYIWEEFPLTVQSQYHRRWIVKFKLVDHKIKNFWPVCSVERAYVKDEKEKKTTTLQDSWSQTVSLSDWAHRHQTQQANKLWPRLSHSKTPPQSGLCLSEKAWNLVNYTVRT